MQKMTSLKNKIYYYKKNIAIIVFFSSVVNICYAAESSLSIKGLLYKIFYHIINPLITFAFTASLIYFMYGVVAFLRNRDTNIPEAEDGKRHLLYGTVGLFIFVSAFAIARIMSSILGGGVPTP